MYLTDFQWLETAYHSLQYYYFSSQQSKILLQYFVRDQAEITSNHSKFQPILNMLHAFFLSLSLRVQHRACNKVFSCVINSSLEIKYK